MNNVCKRCKEPIKVMAYRGTGYCCLDCKKGRKKGSVNRYEQRTNG